MGFWLRPKAAPCNPEETVVGRRRTMWSPLSICDDFDPQVAAARTVKFAQKNTLPPPQDEPSIVDQQRLRVPDHRSLQVSVTIPVIVVIVAITRSQQLEEVVEVPLKTGIIIFVDQEGGGRVRHEEETGATLHPGLGHDLLDEICDVLELHPGVGLDVSGVEPGKGPLGGNHSACFRCHKLSPFRCCVKCTISCPPAPSVGGVDFLERLRQGSRCGGNHRRRSHGFLDDFRRTLYVQPFKQEGEFIFQVISNLAAHV